MIYHNKTDTRKFFLEDSVTQQEIKDYKRKVESNQVPCILPECSRCKVSSKDFTIHERRKRIFYVIVEQIINVTHCLLIRWKCPKCKKTFTQYPWFALPYKRYTLPTITFYSSSYVEDEKTTYRNLTEKNFAAHEVSEDTGSGLEHSTIHRWISTIGNYPEIIRIAQQLIIEKNPCSSIARDVANLSICVKKYLSDPRKNKLISCRGLLLVEKIYKKIFDVSIFPYLATKAGYS